MDNTKTINILSLCTGHGGFELGLSRALEGVFRVVAVEVEAYALANLAAKAQEGKLAIEAMWPDLKTFPAERFRGCFDFILAGYPCQPFSVAGKRLGEADSRWLWPYISRIVQAVQPVWCFFENVPGHLTLGFPAVYRSLRDLGYSVEAGLFTAAECGISMAEGTRLFVLAKANSFNGSILLQGGKPQEAESYVGGPGEVLGEAVSERLQGMRSTKQGRRDEFAPASFAVAPQGFSQKPFEKKRFIKSRLGGAVNGPSRRVDRLRLLGNGVVPDQAEKAFRELMPLFQG